MKIMKPLYIEYTHEKETGSGLLLEVENGWATIAVHNGGLKRILIGEITKWNLEGKKEPEPEEGKERHYLVNIFEQVSYGLGEEDEEEEPMEFVKSYYPDQEILEDDILEMLMEQMKVNANAKDCYRRIKTVVDSKKNITKLIAVKITEDDEKHTILRYYLTAINL